MGDRRPGSSFLCLRALNSWIVIKCEHFLDENAVKELVTRGQPNISAERSCLSPSTKISRRGLSGSGRVIPGHGDLVQDSVRADHGYCPRTGAMQSS